MEMSILVLPQLVKVVVVVLYQGSSYNKNGYYYALERNSLSNGPVWKFQLSTKGGPCPQCGQGSIASSAWDGNYLYVAGGITTISGIDCKGGLRALNPADGSIAWETCLGGTVLGSVTEVPGVVAVVAAKHLVWCDASTGAKLFDYSATWSFYGSPAISNGILYVGTIGGILYAFGL